MKEVDQFGSKVTVNLADRAFLCWEVVDGTIAAAIGARSKACSSEIFEYVLFPATHHWRDLAEAEQVLSLVRNREIWQELLQQAGLTGRPGDYEWLCYVRQYATVPCRYPIGLIFGNKAAMGWLITCGFSPPTARVHVT